MRGGGNGRVTFYCTCIYRMYWTPATGVGSGRRGAGGWGQLWKGRQGYMFAPSTGLLNAFRFNHPSPQEIFPRFHYFSKSLPF